MTEQPDWNDPLTAPRDKTVVRIKKGEDEYIARCDGDWQLFDPKTFEPTGQTLKANDIDGWKPF